MLIVLLIFIPISSASYAPNQLNYNHKPLFCFDCHNGIKVGYGYEYDEGDICSGCHTLYYSNFSKHEALTCKGCHGVNNRDSYHILHNVSCITCHESNTFLDVEYSSCLECHDSGLHSIHIQKSCLLCHVETIKKPIVLPNNYDVDNDEPINQFTNESNNRTLQRFTIFEILKSILTIFK